MKKFLALILAGVMVVSMSVVAFARTGEEIANMGWTTQEEFGSGNLTQDEWTDFYAYLDSVISGSHLPEYLANPSAYMTNHSSSSSSGEEVYDRASEAEALAIQATGIPMETTLAAAEENKSVGEYMNNAVVAAPGLSNAVPVSQGGNVIIDGVPTNQTFSVLKVLSGHTDAAKAQAAAIGGRVLNVARIDASVFFSTATVNFYMPGVTAGQNIQVYQYDYASGQWTSVAVAEIREDHVVVDMTSLGVLAFIEVPAAE